MKTYQIAYTKAVMDLPGVERRLFWPGRSLVSCRVDLAIAYLVPEWRLIPDRPDMGCRGGVRRALQIWLDAGGLKRAGSPAKAAAVFVMERSLLYGKE